MSITLKHAETIMDAVLARARELGCRPVSVVVTDPGAHVTAFKKEDGSAMMRFEMAMGKAYAALALGRSSSLVRLRAEERPLFMRYLMDASDGRIFAEGGELVQERQFGGFGVDGKGADGALLAGFIGRVGPFAVGMEHQPGGIGSFGG